MRLLLDTHVWLWMMRSPERLNESTRVALASTGNKTILSVASVWELAIKHSLGKFPLVLSIDAFVSSSIRDFSLSLLSINLQHAIAAARLPPIHKDPFDRMLVAQAQIEDTVLVTADEVVRRYGGNVLWAA